MSGKYKLKAMVEKIQAIRQAAEGLKCLSGGIQAVDKNADRILASCHMLEINITEVAEMVEMKGN
jgi:branched-subunit amino acid aminotransferase/4-amino-4-deoxychorismate lyase